MLYQNGDGAWEEFTGGVTGPNPDYSSEIKSVGYENLLNASSPNAINYATVTMTDDILTISSTAKNTTPFVAYVFDNLKINDVYTFKSIMLDAKCRMYLQAYFNNA